MQLLMVSTQTKFHMITVKVYQIVLINLIVIFLTWLSIYAYLIVVYVIVLFESVYAFLLNTDQND